MRLWVLLKQECEPTSGSVRMALALRPRTFQQPATDARPSDFNTQ